jgi:hypothetical protein
MESIKIGLIAADVYLASIFRADAESHFVPSDAKVEIGYEDHENYAT